MALLHGPDVDHELTTRSQHPGQLSQGLGAALPGRQVVDHSCKEEKVKGRIYGQQSTFQVNLLGANLAMKKSFFILLSKRRGHFENTEYYLTLDTPQILHPIFGISPGFPKIPSQFPCTFEQIFKVKVVPRTIYQNEMTYFAL